MRRHAELFEELLGKFFTPAAPGVFATRPKLDVGSSYTNFLASSGAI
jgi:hypothetical protein